MDSLVRLVEELAVRTGRRLSLECDPAARGPGDPTRWLVRLGEGVSGAGATAEEALEAARFELLRQSRGAGVGSQPTMSWRGCPARFGQTSRKAGPPATLHPNGRHPNGRWAALVAGRSPDSRRGRERSPSWGERASSHDPEARSLARLCRLAIAPVRPPHGWGRGSGPAHPARG